MKRPGKYLLAVVLTAMAPVCTGALPLAVDDEPGGVRAFDGAHGAIPEGRDAVHVESAGQDQPERAVGARGHESEHGRHVHGR